MKQVDRAYHEIKQRILGNRYPPGLQALEQDLAEQLGVSRTPVREALIRLEREGLVEIIPRRGMRVVPLSADDMREIYDVITCLEAGAAERLAERRPSREELAPMIAAQADMERALEAGDLEAWAAADECFHRQLLALAGNRRLAELTAIFADQVHRARMATLHLRPLPHRSNRDHKALIRAVLAGDPETAHRVHQRHRQHAKELLTKILKRHDLGAL